VPEITGHRQGLCDHVVAPLQQRQRTKRTTHVTATGRVQGPLNASYPLAHPIVRTHRETGEKILWVDFGKHPQIAGLPEAENREVLQLILDRYRKSEHQVRFQWKPGSIAFWDNRAAVHRAVRDYGAFPRHLERVLIDDEPLWRNL
jgi:alpha-ketoglutarate-dependent taurine dioxygenase